MSTVPIKFSNKVLKINNENDKKQYSYFPLSEKHESVAVKMNCITSDDSFISSKTLNKLVKVKRLKSGRVFS